MLAPISFKRTVIKSTKQHHHVNCDVKSKISGRRWTATYRSGRGFRDLKWTMTRWGEPVLSLFNFSLFSHIRSRSGCRRNRFPEKILKSECSVEGQRLGRDCKIINQFWVKLTFGHSVLNLTLLQLQSLVSKCTYNFPL